MSLLDALGLSLNDFLILCIFVGLSLYCFLLVLIVFFDRRP